jgi:chorismate mutase
MSEVSRLDDDITKIDEKIERLVEKRIPHIEALSEIQKELDLLRESREVSQRELEMFLGKRNDRFLKMVNHAQQ